MEYKNLLPTIGEELSPAAEGQNYIDSITAWEKGGEKEEEEKKDPPSPLLLTHHRLKKELVEFANVVEEQFAVNFPANH